jgi:hypothetical protein
VSLCVREGICVAETMHARPFVRAARPLRACISKNGYPQLDRVARSQCAVVGPAYTL